ncbi:MAG: spore maturation protein A [Clostridia bacterium]|nr:spore maturation protein A [Clostridia bacterium]
MLGKIFGIFCILALVFGACSGNLGAVANAIPDGAANAVQVLLSLCGMMCLWCGLMEVLREAGVIRRLSRRLAPLLRPFFPQAFATGEGAEEISACISANLLGIGNAATPLALEAMEKMQRHNPHPSRASGEQITLTVLNTASVTLIPANLLALRRAAGSENPFAIMVPVWVTSVLCAALALLLTTLPRMRDKNAEKRATGAKKRHG